MTEENWTSFQQIITKSPQIRNATNKILHIYNKISQKQTKNVSQTTVDNLWTDITNCINNAANATIPYKKIPSIHQERKETKHDNNLPRKHYRIQNNKHKVLRSIRFKIKRLIKTEGHINDSDLIEWNVKIAKINTLFDIQIPFLHKDKLHLPDWLIEADNWYDIIAHKIKKDLTDNNNKTIQEHINKRCENIASNLKAMTNSLLSKEFNKIHIDRLIVRNNDNPEEKTLITDHEDIKSACDKHYHDQFRKRNYKLNSEGDQFLT